MEQKIQRISLARLQTLATKLGLEPAIPYRELAVTINHVASVILEADLEDARLAEEALERIRRGEERFFYPKRLWLNLAWVIDYNARASGQLRRLDRQTSRQIFA